MSRLFLKIYVGFLSLNLSLGSAFAGSLPVSSQTGKTVKQTYRIFSHDEIMLRKNLENITQDSTDDLEVAESKFSKNNFQNHSVYFDRRDSEGELVLYKSRHSLQQSVPARSTYLLDSHYSLSQQEAISQLSKSLEVKTLRKLLGQREVVKSTSYLLKTSQADVKSTNTSEIVTVTLRSYSFYTVGEIEGQNTKSELKTLEFSFNSQVKKSIFEKFKSQVLNQIEVKSFKDSPYEFAVESLGLVLQ